MNTTPTYEVSIVCKNRDVLFILDRVYSDFFKMNKNLTQDKIIFIGEAPIDTLDQFTKILVDTYKDSLKEVIIRDKSHLILLEYKGEI